MTGWQPIPETSELFRMFQDFYRDSETVVRVEWRGDVVSVTTKPLPRFVYSTNDQDWKVATVGKEE